MTELIVLGDILKSEANPRSRIAIQAPQGTQLGDWVDYPVRNQKLVALSSEKHGQVLVQPHNCVIDLSKISLPQGVDLATLMAQGDHYGIQYQGTPQDSAKTTPNPKRGKASKPAESQAQPSEPTVNETSPSSEVSNSPRTSGSELP